MPAALRNWAGRRLETRVDKGLRWADEQFGIHKGLRKLLDHIFPDHWSFMLGEIALYSFVTLVLTGVFLALYFDPSSHTYLYHGPYRPLYGHSVTAAYGSTVDISTKVRSGLLFRQMHHWAADVFLGAVVAHLLRIFFTGAFRKPRATNWVIGVTMFFAGIIEGYVGYSMPGDLLSGTGVRIGYSILESMPVIGSYLAVFLFRGQYPGDGVIYQRFFIAHVFLLPVLIATLLAVHLGLIMRQKHTQFPQPSRTEHNVVGSPMYPRFMFKSLGLLFLVVGILTLLGGLVQINPIWQYGPYDSWKVSFAAQPDWFMGWIEGAMRLFPSWDFSAFGHEVVLDLFLPAVVMPTLTFLMLIAWPYLDSRISGDRSHHHLLERPRDNPVRTAIGAGIFAFFAIMFIASSDDLVANFFALPLQSEVWGLRAAIVSVPWIVGFVTFRICEDLRRPPPPPAEVVLVEDHYEVEQARPEPHGELEPEKVPAFVVAGPVSMSVPRAVEEEARGKSG
jgi:ubiquinol-cytochrome c reductase cytochrome b subunit